MFSCFVFKTSTACVIDLTFFNVSVEAVIQVSLSSFLVFRTSVRTVISQSPSSYLFFLLFPSSFGYLVYFVVLRLVICIIHSKSPSSLPLSSSFEQIFFITIF